MAIFYLDKIMKKIMKYCQMMLPTLFGFGERNLLERITRTKSSRIENKHFHLMIKKKNSLLKSKKQTAL